MEFLYIHYNCLALHYHRGESNCMFLFFFAIGKYYYSSTHSWWAIYQPLSVPFYTTIKVTHVCVGSKQNLGEPALSLVFFFYRLLSLNNLAIEEIINFRNTVLTPCLTSSMAPSESLAWAISINTMNRLILVYPLAQINLWFCLEV